MRAHVCPWWFAYTFDNPLRRLWHKPEQLLAPYVTEGMKVLDVGCGMGFFAIAMARMVGDSGEVIAADLQPRMFKTLCKRAHRAGVASRIRTHPCQSRSMNLTEAIDFALLFWMAHEVPDPLHLFRELHSCLKPSGRLLLAEPAFHLSRTAFEREVQLAMEAGFHPCDGPNVALSLAIWLEPTVPGDGSNP